MPIHEIESEPSDSDTIESLDEEIKRYREVMLRLERRRNRLLPIAQLPPEILGKIFLFNVLEGLTDFSCSIHSWINVTFVSHHWREVAYNSPELWSFWGQCSPRWFTTLVSHSKAAPVEVRLGSNQLWANLPQIFDIPGIHDRIRKLHVEAENDLLVAFFGEDGDPKNTTSPSVDSSSGHPSPLTSIRIIDSSFHSFAFHTSKLPESFFSRLFPQLQVLELVGCQFDWESPMFSSPVLEQLTIGGNSNHPSMAQLLSILEKQPLLSHLDLHLGRWELKNESSVPNVHFPHIRSLKLAGFVPSTFNLVQNLSYDRRTTDIVLDTSSTYELPDHSTDTERYFFPFLLSHYGSRNSSSSSAVDDAPAIVSLFLHDNGWSYEFQAWSDLQRSLPSCHIIINWAFFTSMMCPISTPICQFLPLDNLRELTVMGVEMDPEGWVELFAEMEPIEELVLYKDECASVIPVLNPGPKKDAREIATSAESNVPSDPDVASPTSLGD